MAEENEIIYNDLNSSITRFNEILLESFVPKPETADYEKGYITRYFIAKAWDPETIIEVSPNKYSSDFPQLNAGAYVSAEIDWYISGNIRDYVLSGGFKEGVLSKNTKSIDLAKVDVPSIIMLRNNLLQFYRSNNLYTNGGEFTLTPGSGQSYIGLYHINPGLGPMVGPFHKDDNHPILYPMDGSNPADIGNSMGGGF